MVGMKRLQRNMPYFTRHHFTPSSGKKRTYFFSSKSYTLNHSKSIYHQSYQRNTNAVKFKEDAAISTKSKVDNWIVSHFNDVTAVPPPCLKLPHSNTQPQDICSLGVKRNEEHRKRVFIQEPTEYRKDVHKKCDQWKKQVTLQPSLNTKKYTINKSNSKSKKSKKIELTCRCMKDFINCYYPAIVGNSNSHNDRKRKKERKDKQAAFTVNSVLQILKLKAEYAYFKVIPFMLAGSSSSQSNSSNACCQEQCIVASNADGANDQAYLYVVQEKKLPMKDMVTALCLRLGLYEDQIHFGEDEKSSSSSSSGASPMTPSSPESDSTRRKCEYTYEFRWHSLRGQLLSPRQTFGDVQHPQHQFGICKHTSVVIYLVGRKN